MPPSRLLEDPAWRRWAALVLLAALLLRLAPMAAHGFLEDRVTTADSAAYLSLSRELRDQGELAQGGRPEVFRTPGYPLFLALLSYLPGSPVVWALWIQALLGVGVVAAALILARRWGSRAASLAAGALLAIDPAHIVASNLVMSDVLGAAAVAGAVVLAERGRTSGALGAGLLLSLATAVRPVVFLLIVPVAALLARRGASRRALVAALALALAFPAAWTARNGLRADRWTVSSAFDLNLGLVLAAKIVARGEGIGLDEARSRLAERGAVLDPLGDAAGNRRIAARAIVDYPLPAAEELALSVAEMLVAGERRQALRLLGSARGSDRVESIGEAARGGGGAGILASVPFGELILVGAQLVLNAAVLLLAAIGCWWLWRRGDRLVLAVALAAIALVLAPSLVVATGRMRIPVSLFLAILAGIGLGGPRASPR